MYFSGRRAVGIIIFFIWLLPSFLMWLFSPVWLDYSEGFLPLAGAPALLTTWLFFTELIMSEGHLIRVSQHSWSLATKYFVRLSDNYLSFFCHFIFLVIFCCHFILFVSVPRWSWPLSSGPCTRSWPSFMTRSAGWRRRRPSSSTRSSTPAPGGASPTPPPGKSATTTRTTTAGTTETEIYFFFFMSRRQTIWKHLLVKSVEVN